MRSEHSYVKGDSGALIPMPKFCNICWPFSLQSSCPRAWKQVNSSYLHMTTEIQESCPYSLKNFVLLAKWDHLIHKYRTIRISKYAPLPLVSEPFMWELRFEVSRDSSRGHSQIFSRFLFSRIHAVRLSNVAVHEAINRNIPASSFPSSIVTLRQRIHYIFQTTRKQKRGRRGREKALYIRTGETYVRISHTSHEA
jgi:hypothetical protein